MIHKGYPPWWTDKETVQTHIWLCQIMNNSIEPEILVRMRQSCHNNFFFTISGTINSKEISAPPTQEWHLDQNREALKENTSDNVL